MTRRIATLTLSLFAVGCSCSDTDDRRDDASRDDTDATGTTDPGGTDEDSDGTGDDTDVGKDDSDTDGGASTDDSDGSDDSDAHTDPPQICTPGDATCLDETTLEACADDGYSWGTLDCPSGCDATSAPASCEVATLDSWELHVFSGVPSASPLTPRYAFESNGTVAVQTENALPSAYTYTASVDHVRVSGRVTVNIVADDDFIGLVFGWQDPEHFYLLDWKQGTQDDPECGLASAGVSLKKVSASAPIDDCTTLWSSADSVNTTVLSAATLNPTGWSDFTAYTFVLEYRPGDIRVEIRQGSSLVATLTSTDATWASGRFGFYNYSQEEVRYEFVQFEPWP